MQATVNKILILRWNCLMAKIYAGCWIEVVEKNAEAQFSRSDEYFDVISLNNYWELRWWLCRLLVFRKRCNAAIGLLSEILPELLTCVCPMQETELRHKCERVRWRVANNNSNTCTGKHLPIIAHRIEINQLHTKQKCNLSFASMRLDDFILEL